MLIQQSSLGASETFGDLQNWWNMGPCKKNSVKPLFVLKDRRILKHCQDNLKEYDDVKISFTTGILHGSWRFSHPIVGVENIPLIHILIWVGRWYSFGHMCFQFNSYDIISSQKQRCMHCHATYATINYLEDFKHVTVTLQKNIKRKTSWCWKSPLLGGTQGSL